MPAARDEIDPATSIPDIRTRPIGTDDASAAAILARVLRKAGAEVPVAAFQSSI